MFCFLARQWASHPAIVRAPLFIFRSVANGNISLRQLVAGNRVHLRWPVQDFERSGDRCSARLRPSRQSFILLKMPHFPGSDAVYVSAKDSSGDVAGQPIMTMKTSRTKSAMAMSLKSVA